MKKIIYSVAGAAVILTIIYLAGVLFWSSEKGSASIPVNAGVDSSNFDEGASVPYDTISPQPKSVKKKKQENTPVEKPEVKIKIIAYYFHPTARCQTCLNIENFSREVVETKFEKEFKGGTIIFRALNIEDSANEHYRDEYNLEYSSLILTKLAGERQTKWKNLEYVWKFAHDKEQFFKYVTFEIKNYLNEKERSDEH